MGRPPTRLDGPHRFKLGLFGMNCSNGLTMTRAPEAWDQSWDNNVAAAQLADAAGLEFLLPVGRWHGYRGTTDTQGTSFETLTWAAGLLGATQGISCFGTVHVSHIHPVFAAKQVVTADHIGHGRMGLNVVSGWNPGEFAMFGDSLLEHDERYAYTEEWITVAKRLWTEAEPFDFHGRYFDLVGVLGKPKPYGGGLPMIMSAGSSTAGRGFAGRHAECLFMNIFDHATLAQDITTLRASVPDRRVGVYASGHIISRATERETREYYNYIVHDMGDWDAAEHIVSLRIAGGGQSIPAERVRALTERHVSGIGTCPIVGSYDQVAETFLRFSEAGLDGIAVGLVHFVNDFPMLRDEILPRMVRLGLRQG